MPTSYGHETEPLDVAVTQYEQPDAYVMVLRGILDQTNDNALTDAFTAAAASSRHLIVDLAGMDHGDETLLGLLLKARITGLTLVGPLPATFAERLDTTGTRSEFTIRPNLTSALGDLAI